MAEAVALGKPVIATGYSGNLTFLNEENSYLVGYSMSSVPPGTLPYREGAAWVEPDLDEAAARMREVYLNQEESAARGLLAREQARTNHTPEKTAEFIDRRMADIRRIQGERREGEFRRQLKAGLTRRLGFQRPSG
jgi:glycosyltransferase involved in cell wall biosynthesis